MAVYANYIEKNTVMLVAQSSAPLGWTKLTTHNDKWIRLTNSTVGSGGTYSFSEVFSRSDSSSARIDGGATTLTSANIESHTHGSYKNNGSNSNDSHPFNSNNKGNSIATSSVGGGGSHTHSVGLDVLLAYVDVIMCRKD